MKSVRGTNRNDCRDGQPNCNHSPGWEQNLPASGHERTIQSTFSQIKEVLKHGKFKHWKVQPITAVSKREYWTRYGPCVENDALGTGEVGKYKARQNAHEGKQTMV